MDWMVLILLCFECLLDSVLVYTEDSPIAIVIGFATADAFHVADHCLTPPVNCGNPLS